MEFKKKFSFHELTSNKDGKTSASGVAGLYITLIGGLTFALGAIHCYLTKEATIMLQSIILIGFGLSLLGFRKSIQPKPDSTEDKG